MRLNGRTVYNSEIRCVVCSKCGDILDADYNHGMVKVIPFTCKCVEVSA